MLGWGWRRFDDGDEKKPRQTQSISGEKGGLLRVEWVRGRVSMGATWIQEESLGDALGVGGGNPSLSTSLQSPFLRLGGKAILRTDPFRC